MLSEFQFLSCEMGVLRKTPGIVLQFQAEPLKWLAPACLRVEKEA